MKPTFGGEYGFFQPSITGAAPDLQFSIPAEGAGQAWAAVMSGVAAPQLPASGPAAPTIVGESATTAYSQGPLSRPAVGNHKARNQTSGQSPGGGVSAAARPTVAAVGNKTVAVGRPRRPRPSKYDGLETGSAAADQEELVIKVSRPTGSDSTSSPKGQFKSFP